MKILGSGDLHLRFKKPALRLDESYCASQFDKVVEILNIAEEEECDVIVISGDVFDDSDSSNYIEQLYIKLFSKFIEDTGIQIYCVAGQHDKRYHTKRLENTTLGVLESAKALKIIRNDKPIEYKERKVTFYGVSWGEEIPEIKDPDVCNVLLIHKMVLKDGPLWVGQENYLNGKSFLDRSGFDFIVSGDNHNRFSISNKRETRHLVNPGSLMRSRVDQAQHKPAVYIFDTETKELEARRLTIEHPSKVLDVEKSRALKRADDKMEKFVDGLDDTEGLDFDFIEIVYEIMNKSKSITDGVRSIVEEVFKLVGPTAKG